MAALTMICVLAVAATLLLCEGAPQQYPQAGRTPLRVVRVRMPSRVMIPPFTNNLRGLQRFTQASMRPSPMYGLSRRANRRDVPITSIASSQSVPATGPADMYDPEVDGMLAPAFPNMSPPEVQPPPPAFPISPPEVPPPPPTPDTDMGSEDRIAPEMMGMTAEDVAGMDVPEVPGTVPGASVPVVPVAILSQTQEDDFNGTFNYSFEADNGISVQLKGLPKTLSNGEVVQTMEGRYSYQSPEGTPITTQWFADETGFHAEGAHIPGKTNSL